MTAPWPPLTPDPDADPLFAEAVAAGVAPDLARIVLALAAADVERDYAARFTPSNAKP